MAWLAGLLFWWCPWHLANQSSQLHPRPPRNLTNNFKDKEPHTVRGNHVINQTTVSENLQEEIPAHLMNQPHSDGRREEPGNICSEKEAMAGEPGGSQSAGKTFKKQIVTTH